MLKSHQENALREIVSNSRQRPFYARRLAELPDEASCAGIQDWFERIPLLTKDELIGDGGSAAVFDLPPENYVRWHQTSGTTGRPMVVRDTRDDWCWWLDCWDHVLDAANVTPADVALMAFSFGPFIGFWTANDALIRRGATVIPGGGLSTRRRLELLQSENCTVLCATPTYALHLAAVAAQLQIDLASGPRRKLIVAGEPGGSIPATRRVLEAAFNASVIDHVGASEIGAWGYGREDGRGIHVIESQFIAEVRSKNEDGTLGPEVNQGETGELVLTSLGRTGGPVIRYRTGDLVRPASGPDQDQNLFLDGGVIGRVDDMVVVRGVNVFPSSIDAIVREVTPSAEYRVNIVGHGEMNDLQIDLEDAPENVERLRELLLTRLAMRVAVHQAEPGTLPRFEAKAKRWNDQRPGF